MEPWELVARERIRDTMARYNWAGDAFRLDELAAAFVEDGVLEVRDHETVQGRAAVVDFLGGGSGADDEARRNTQRAAAAETGVRRVVRHVVTNVRFVEVTPERARVDSYFTVFTEIGPDHFGRYRDTFVPVGDDWLIEHRLVTTDWHAPNSTMTAPPGRT